MKKKERIGQVIQEFWQDALRQLFGWNAPRPGKLQLTRYGLVKMQENKLDTRTLEDVFRYGEHRNRGDKVQVIRQYHNYSVGLWYKVIYTPAHPNISAEKRYLVITCWKR